MNFSGRWRTTPEKRQPADRTVVQLYQDIALERLDLETYRRALRRMRQHYARLKDKIIETLLHLGARFGTKGEDAIIALPWEVVQKTLPSLVGSSGEVVETLNKLSNSRAIQRRTTGLILHTKKLKALREAESRATVRVVRSPVR
jgi:hypothetical protein